MVRLKVLALAVAFGVVSLFSSGVASAQEVMPTPDDAITAAQTALGIDAGTLMYSAIGAYGPILLIGLSFLIAMGLLWRVVAFFFRGSKKSS